MSSLKIELWCLYEIVQSCFIEVANVILATNTKVSLFFFPSKELGFFLMRLGRFRWNSERFFAKSRLEVEKRESRESQIFTEAWKPNKGEPSVKTDVYQSHVSTRRFSIERGTEEDSSGSRGYLGNFSNRRNPREPLQRSGIGIPPTIVRSLLRSSSLSLLFLELLASFRCNEGAGVRRTRQKSRETDRRDRKGRKRNGWFVESRLFAKERRYSSR